MLLFITVPNPIFCEAVDKPCSCVGGGFEIYEPFCNTSLSNSSQASRAQYAYDTVPPFLAENSDSLLVSLGLVALTALVFVAARIQIKADKQVAEARERSTRTRAEGERLKEETAFLAAKLAEAEESLKTGRSFCLCI